MSDLVNENSKMVKMNEERKDNEKLKDDVCDKKMYNYVDINEELDNLKEEIEININNGGYDELKCGTDNGEMDKPNDKKEEKRDKNAYSSAIAGVPNIQSHNQHPQSSSCTSYSGGSTYSTDSTSSGSSFSLTPEEAKRKPSTTNTRKEQLSQPSSKNKTNECNPEIKSDYLLDVMQDVNDDDRKNDHGDISTSQTDSSTPSEDLSTIKIVDESSNDFSDLKLAGLGEANDDMIINCDAEHLNTKKQNSRDYYIKRSVINANRRSELYVVEKNRTKGQLFHYEIFKNSDIELENSNFLYSTQNHPQIVRYIDKFENKKNTIFITEYCNLSMLIDTIKYLICNSESFNKEYIVFIKSLAIH